MLELAVLGLLKEKPMSGYELQKALTAKLGAFWRVSFGSLYPCLKRLNADGALEVLDSSYMSRKKHVYRLTAEGETLFRELLESADVNDFEQDRFSLRLAFFRYLQPENRLDQLERRRGYLQQRLGDLRSSLRSARDRLDAYTLSLMDHGLEEREREIAWLDRLIAAERGGGGLEARTAVDGPVPDLSMSDPIGGHADRGQRRRAARARRAARPRGEAAEAASTGPPPEGPDQQELGSASGQTPPRSDPSQPTQAGSIARMRRKSR